MNAIAHNRDTGRIKCMQNTADGVLKWKSRLLGNSEKVDILYILRGAAWKINVLGWYPAQVANKKHPYVINQSKIQI